MRDAPHLLRHLVWQSRRQIVTAFIVSAASDVGRTGWYVVARIVIVGAGLSGLRTVEELRRAGFEGELTLAGGETHLPYDRASVVEGSDPRRQGRDDLASGRVLRREQGRSQARFAGNFGGTRSPSRWRSPTDPPWTTTSWSIATGLTPRRIAGLPELSGVHVLRSIEEALAPPRRPCSR